MKRAWLVALIGALTIGAGFAKFAYDNFYAPASQIQYSPNPMVIVKSNASPAPDNGALPSDLQVQAALAKMGIPVGAVDGKWGQRTRQGFCIWRTLTGRQENRDLIIDIERREIVNASKNLAGAASRASSAGGTNIEGSDGTSNVLNSEFSYFKLPDSFAEGLNISKTCQSAIWLKPRGEYRVMIASTGRSELPTDTGTFKVGWKVNRWYESIAYPDGWMYRPLFFNRGQAVHGSEFDSMVNWHPASHGCVRMLGRDIDALWAGGFGIGSTVKVYGNWAD